ncbi:MAG: ribonuclease HII [Bacillota bacterium]|nr:ribonuclease HII [Bacillota bacterium]
MKKPTIKEIEMKLKDIEPLKAPEFLKQMQIEYGIGLDRLIEKYDRRKLAYEEEIQRFNSMCEYEKKAYASGVEYVAGIDEAGRGPLAGPVVAAAVILPKDVFIPGLNDSKQVSYAQRNILFDVIKAKAISYGIGIIDEKCIDEINILNATKKAMVSAVEMLGRKPEILLIDALKLDDINIEQIDIIKGDCKSISIAAASIIAKVTRDRLIEEMDSLYPQYGFAKHKGYGTSEHIEAIRKYGLCPIHRRSFTGHFTG